MPRPTHKSELLDAAESEFARLNAMIDALPPAARDAEFTGDGRDRNVRDVVAHLAEWHTMLVGWLAESHAGGTPAVPGEGYTWQTLDALNATIREKWSAVTLVEAMQRNQASHEALLDAVRALSKDDLFTVGRYPWTGPEPLADFVNETMAHHYLWAMAAIDTNVDATA